MLIKLHEYFGNEIKKWAVSEKENQIFAEIRNSSEKDLTISLEGIDLIDSTGIGLLIRMRKVFTEKRGRKKASVSVTNMTKHIFEESQAMSLDTIFEISR